MAVRSRVRASISIVTATLAQACIPEAPGGGWVAERSVSGDTVTVHTVVGQVWPSAVRPVEEVTIGALEGPDELVFGEVSRMAEDQRGGVYVLDGQVPVIRRFDRDGEYVGTVGRAGEGPGEYARLALGMVVDSDGVVYMHDWGNRRIVRFADDGSALESWSLDSPFLTTARGTWVFSDGPGRILVTARVEDAPALLVLEEGQVMDTLPVPRLPGLPARRGGPYRIETHWSWHPDGYFVAGVSDDYSLIAVRADRVLRIRRDVDGLPVHPEEAEAWRRRFEWMQDRPRYRPPEGEWIPSVMPPFRGIEVSTDGRIWVQRNTVPIQIPIQEAPEAPPPVGWAQPFVYDVFEPDGSFLGEVRFPDRFEPHVFGQGYVWGVRRGDFDEEYVVRLSLPAGNDDP